MWYKSKASQLIYALILVVIFPFSLDINGQWLNILAYSSLYAETYIELID